MWLYSLLWAVLPLLGWSQYSTEAYGTTCSYDYFATQPLDSYFLLVVVIGDFVLPLLVICYCYTWILLKFRAHQQKYGPILRRTDGRSSEYTGSKPSPAVSQSGTRKSTETSAPPFSAKSFKAKFKTTEFKIARTVVFVVLAFGVSWTPYAVVCMIGESCDLRFLHNNPE